MSILDITAPAISPQYIVGLQNIVDRAPGVILGATTALTSVGLLTYPSKAFQGNASEIIAFCSGRHVVTAAQTVRFVVILDAAVTLFDSTLTPGFLTAQFQMIVRLSKLFPGGLASQFNLFFDMVEVSSGAVPQERVSGNFISPSSTFDNPPVDGHSIDFQLAKSLVGDTLQSFYAIAKVL